MAAPGDNLEFNESLFFKVRTSEAPNILEAVIELLRNRPDTGKLLCAGIREIELEVEGSGFVIFLARRENSIGLMYVYQMHETALIEDRKKKLIRLYGKGGKQ